MDAANAGTLSLCVASCYAALAVGAKPLRAARILAVLLGLAVFMTALSIVGYAVDAEGRLLRSLVVLGLLLLGAALVNGLWRGAAWAIALFLALELLTSVSAIMGGRLARTDVLTAILYLLTWGALVYTAATLLLRSRALNRWATSADAPAEERVPPAG